MEWLIFALLRAFFVTGKETSTKLSLLRPISSVTISAFYTTVVSVAILLPYVLWDGSWSSLKNPLFAYGVLGNICLNTMGHLLILTTIRRFDISYVSTILATSPLVFGIFSTIFLGDNPGLYAFLFMGLIACGGVLAEISRDNIKGFKKVLLNSGWVPLLAYMCIAAGATVFSKIAVSNGDPEAYVAFRYTGLSIIFLIIHFLYESNFGHQIIKRNRQPIAIHVDFHAITAGLFTMCAVICEMNALKLSDMASVESITKFSIIGTLLVDTFFISKKVSWIRWLAALLILIGGLGIIS